MQGGRGRRKRDSVDYNPHVLTYRQLHDRAAVVLKARKFEQVPQLEGRTSRFDEQLFTV